jgi:hypothetical protein
MITMPVLIASSDDFRARKGPDLRVRMARASMTEGSGRMHQDGTDRAVFLLDA